MSFRTPFPHSVLLFASVLLLGLVPAAAAVGPNSDARLIVHLTSPVSKNACALVTDPPDCFQIDASGQVDIDSFAYVIISNVSSTGGLAAAQFGITYDGAPESGVDVFSWTSCGNLGYPSDGWPAAGTGIRVTWISEGCFHPPVVGGFAMAVVGYFSLTAYSPDEFGMARHPSDNQASVIDCSLFNEDVIELGTANPFGWATFSADGTALGSVPCGFFGGGCHLSGPTAVDTGQTGIQYTMDPDEVTANGFWTVNGHGQLVSGDNTAATVDATTPGTFTIGYQREGGCIEGCGCSVTVQVLAPLPVRPTTWGRIKSGYGVTGRD
jgi:hypothetical protein